MTIVARMGLPVFADPSVMIAMTENTTLVTKTLIYTSVKDMPFIAR